MIKYSEYRYGNLKDVTMELDEWIERSLAEGGIESRLDKALKLLSIVGGQYLKEHPDKLDDVVRAIDCEGYNHTIKEKL